ncbi:hypothetical protein [Actinoplanes sp. NPDC026619]|uniref:hypothetical protein n=1 Tax=Actinoplanes sp. NPDC026619 TaxID=3155798 RepID=UPI0033DB720B
MSTKFTEMRGREGDRPDGNETGGNDPMRSLGMLQIAGGVVAAGIVAAGATAMTGTGVSWAGSGTGTAAQYVGGTLTQTVSGGASITDINYTTTDSSGNSVGDRVTGIQVIVAGANGAYLTITPSTGGTGLVTATKWSCSGSVAATVLDATAVKVHLNATPATVTCITSDNASAAAGYYDGLTGVQLAVTNS